MSIVPAEQLTPGIIADIKAALTPAQTCGLTMWAEGRSSLVKSRGWVSNPLSAMVDILEVIHNRAMDPRWKKLSHKGVCFQRWAFSCWEPTGGPDDPNDADLLAENFEALIDRAQHLIAGDPPTDKLLNCIAAAEGCIAGALADSLPGATHYYADWIPAPAWAAAPARLVATRFGHLFYRDVK